MRTIIFLVLLALTTSVSASGSGGGGVSPSPSPSSASAGGYSDPKLIIQYPLQQGLMLFKNTTYKYGG